MNNNNDDFNKPYVFCGVCYKSVGPFHLTSCAHILCEYHYAQQLVPKICPVCKITEISTIKLDSKVLPTELKSYFQPFLPALENIYAIARFQYEGITDMVGYQKKVIEKMTSKIAQQRDVMKNVREELIKAREYKNQINSLNEELGKLRKQNADLTEKVQQFKGKASNLEPKATSTMKSGITNSNTNAFKYNAHSAQKSSVASTATPSLVPKTFASSVQKHISAKVVKRPALPPKVFNSRVSSGTLPAPKRSNTDFEIINTKPSPFKPVGTRYQQSNRVAASTSQRDKTSNVSVFRTLFMPHESNTSRASNTQVPHHNNHFPLPTLSSSRGRKSIPTRPDTQSSFRRLYSSRGSNHSEVSWSISKHK